MSFSAASTCSRDPVGSRNGIVISFFLEKKISLDIEEHVESIAFFVHRLWFIEKQTSWNLEILFFHFCFY